MYKQNGKVWLPSTEDILYHFAFEDHFSILSPHFVLHCLFLPTFAYKLNCLSTPYLKTYCKTFSFSGLVFTGMAAYLNWRRCFCCHREQNMCSWPKTKKRMAKSCFNSVLWCDAIKYKCENTDYFGEREMQNVSSLSYKPSNRQCAHIILHVYLLYIFSIPSIFYTIFTKPDFQNI